MAILRPEDRDRMFMESVSFAKEEAKRRLQAPVQIKAEEIRCATCKSLACLPRRSALGFQSPNLSFLDQPHSGRRGRRHGLENPGPSPHGGGGDLCSARSGHSIIDGVRHDWAPGDFISVPMFSWHRHLNTGNEDFIYLAATTGPLSLALGLAVYEDERYPDYWVFGHKSESAMKSMIPGADDSTRISTQAASTTAPLNPTDALYREQLVFSGGEEKRRRASRVVSE